MKVSVIVALYNAEKYIAECLDSLLAQTFVDFEVIVVDDCSTDSSCAIVEGYHEKFNGRLTLSHMETNTGCGALPRNKGMMLACGEYVAFLDDDDMFTKTALEELYTLAKDFDADVVYCEDNYRIKPDGSGVHREIQGVRTLVDKPTFEADSLEIRVQQILQDKYLQPQWKKFVRRSLIVEHEIFSRTRDLPTTTSGRSRWFFSRKNSCACRM
ncbi:MAG: glycosyltransferase family 2 protein [Selenomonadaceae bacterium]|nr:glycosyltransferase family 2 protein [Selenomonadaceae bacterium]